MADMNAKRDETEALAARLRQTEPEVADAGFTAAVMARLPKTARLSEWQRNAILLTATALGSILAAAQVRSIAVPELLNVATANWPALFGTATLTMYAMAAVAIWMTSDR